MKHLSTCIVLIVCLGAWLPVRAADIVKAGKAKAVIVMAPDAFAWKPPAKKRRRRRGQPKSRFADVRLAADELIEHIEKMSGAKLEVIAKGTDLGGRTPIYLDQAADARLDALTKKTSMDPAAFTIGVTPTAISIRGLSPEGSLFGTYELLEQLGVRWFMPGDVGRVVPQSKDVTVKDQQTAQGPSFAARWTAGYASKFPRWQRRNRMGGPFFPPAHGVHLPKTHSFKEHPEYYALIGGVRKKRQLCVSNPEVVKGAVATVRAYFKKNPNAPWIGIGPHDGRGFCECDKCKALDGGDWDPFAAHMSMSDRYIWFFNQILDGIKDEFPKKKVCFYSYAAYNRPPVKHKPNPRIIPAFAPITLCRIHGIGNPICPEKDKYYRWLIQEWGKIIPEVYDRGYWFNLADPGFLFPMVHRIRKQIPISKKLGITGWRVECLAHWASECPSLYIAGKLMWNVDADVDALMLDFYKSYFGAKAAKPMQKYFELMDHSVRDTDAHTGSSYSIPQLYPDKVRKRGYALLAEADEAAENETYKKRVLIFKQVLDYTDAFINMINQRAGHQWKEANTSLKRIDDTREILAAYDVELVTKRYGISYMKRFFRHCTEQGYERAVTKGKVLGGLPDEWHFNLDPGRIGESLEWFSIDLTGGNWWKLRTSTASWSDQGLRVYKGDAWYRQTVKLGAIPKDAKVFLWCGGVDEKAKIWVNGKPLGESPGKAFLPFEVDATAAVKANAENVVVFRVTNNTLNELGTGGITAPVFFWTPHGKDHKAEQGGEDVTPEEFK